MPGRNKLSSLRLSVCLVSVARAILPGQVVSTLWVAVDRMQNISVAIEESQQRAFVQTYTATARTDRLQPVLPVPVSDVLFVFLKDLHLFLYAYEHFFFWPVYMCSMCVPDVNGDQKRASDSLQ